MRTSLLESLLAGDGFTVRKQEDLRDRTGPIASALDTRDPDHPVIYVRSGEDWEVLWAEMLAWGQKLRDLEREREAGVRSVPVLEEFDRAVGEEMTGELPAVARRPRLEVVRGREN